MTSEQKSLFRRFGVVAAIDTTYHMTKYQMPLLLLTVLNSKGFTCIAASCLVTTERTSDVDLFLERVTESSGYRPDALLSDRALATKAAVKLWAGVAHTLCTFHIYVNINDQVKRRVNDERAFWLDFSYVQKASTKASFKIRMEALSHRWASMSAYLTGLMQIADSWANYAKADLFTAGLSTTGTVESMNRIIRHFAPKKVARSSIVNLFSAIKEANAYRHTKEKLSDLMCPHKDDHLPHTSLAILKLFSSLIEELRDHVTNFAINAVVREMHDHVFWSVAIVPDSSCVATESEAAVLPSHNAAFNCPIEARDIPIRVRNAIDDDGTVYHVRNKNATHVYEIVVVTEFDYTCTCKIPSQSGFPCEHFFAV